MASPKPEPQTELLQRQWPILLRGHLLETLYIQTEWQRMPNWPQVCTGVQPWNSDTWLTNILWQVFYTELAGVVSSRNRATFWHVSAKWWFQQLRELQVPDLDLGYDHFIHKESDNPPHDTLTGSILWAAISKSGRWGWQFFSSWSSVVHWGILLGEAPSEQHNKLYHELLWITGELKQLKHAVGFRPCLDSQS